MAVAAIDGVIANQPKVIVLQKAVVEPQGANLSPTLNLGQGPFQKINWPLAVSTNFELAFDLFFEQNQLALAIGFTCRWHRVVDQALKGCAIQ
ncbi:MAG: hypothetical protein JWQ69_2415 [Pseudomonas sp.]|nr:hypothetical protein [Pseudomonas sp.]